MVVLYNCKVDAGVTEDEHENCIALRPAVLPGRTYYFAAARSHEDVSLVHLCSRARPFSFERVVAHEKVSDAGFLQTLLKT